MSVKDFDLLKVTGLKSKPKNNKKYATFNQRLMALTLDSFVILLLFAGFIDSVVRAYVPMVPINIHELQDKMHQAGGAIASLKVFFAETAHAGILSRWIANSLTQGVIYTFMCAICWNYWSATPGKMIMRLRIADAVTEQPITRQQVLRRLAGYYLSAAAFFIGFLSVGFNKKRQGWHDKMAGTVVLVKPIPWRALWERLKGLKQGSRADNP